MELQPRLRHVGLISLALVLAATGCTAETPAEEEVLSTTPPPSQAPRQTPETNPSPPTPTPTRNVVSIPPCDDMLTTEQVRAVARDDARIGPLSTIAWSAEALPGPLARAAYEAARTTTSCGWGIPQSDGVVNLEVALLEAQAERELQTALSTSSEYSQDASSGVDVFYRAVEDGIGSVLAYALSDGVWVIVDATLVDETTAAGLARDVMGRILAS